jgi:hypothetical protein
LVLVQGIIDQAQEFLRLHPSIKDAKDILEIIFFYGTPVSYGLIKVLRWLRGRDIPAVGQGVVFKNDGIVEINIHNETIEVHRDVYNLVVDPGVRRAVEGLVTPLYRDGIDSVEFRKSDSPPETIVKEEIQYYKAGEIGEEIVLDNEREAVLALVRLSFSREHKWGFSDGATKITASIDDPEFWARIQSGQGFAKGDQLRVKIRTKTSRKETGDLKTEYRISRVVEYIPRHHRHQIEFLPGNTL